MTKINPERISLRALSAAPGDVRDIFLLIKNQPASIFKEWGVCGRKLEMIEKLLLENETFAVMLDAEKVVGMIGRRYKEKYYVWGFDDRYWLHTLIDHKYGGKGIATIATELFLEYLGRCTELTHLHSGIYDTNLASIRVKEKLGFKEMARWKNIVVFEKDLHQQDVEVEESEKSEEEEDS